MCVHNNPGNACISHCVSLAVWGVSQCVCVCTVALAVWRSFSVRVHNMLAMWASAGECVNSNTGCVDISVRACTHSTTGSVGFSQCVRTLQ